jgi:hypothetical protein
LSSSVTFVDLLNRRKLSVVNNTRRELLRNTGACLQLLGTVYWSSLLVRENWEGVLCKLYISIEVIEALVV